MVPDLIFAAGLCYAIDGDTLRCDETRVRLWGIDAPEKDERSRRALALLIDRKEIRCIVKGKSYNRVVAQCYTEVDLQCELLKQGNATEWLRYSHNFYAKCSQGRQKP